MEKLSLDDAFDLAFVAHRERALSDGSKLESASIGEQRDLANSSFVIRGHVAAARAFLRQTGISRSSDG
jgi:hypothetical protein